MGRGQRPEEYQSSGSPSRRSRSGGTNPDRAAKVSLTLWIEPNPTDKTRVDITANAAGYDTTLSYDYDIDLADAVEIHAADLSLALLRSALFEALVRRVAHDLGVPYRSGSGIAAT